MGDDYIFSKVWDVFCFFGGGGVARLKFTFEGSKSQKKKWKNVEEFFSLFNGI